MDDLQYILNTKNYLDSAIKTRDNLLSQINSAATRIKILSGLDADLLEAKLVISSEIDKIQATLKENIDKLITLAINIVYEGRDLEFSLSFKRTAAGNSQYKPIIIENGEEFDPKDEQCGGVLDVMSYAMGISLAGFEVEKGRPFRFSDEPFKFLGGGELAEKAADMAKKINSDLKIQSVIISHDDKSIKTADKVYNIIHDGKKSIAHLVYDNKPKQKRIKRIR